MSETTDQPALGPRYERALGYAADHHRAQRRKGKNVPYIAHLLSVNSIVLKLGGDEDEAIAGLLHDVVEDGGGPAASERIRSEFGERVERIVLECSDSFDGAEEKPKWVDRKQAYLDGVGTKSASALLVSLADKLDNSRDLVADLRLDGPETLQRFGGKADGTLWYYRSLVQRFEGRRNDLNPRVHDAIEEFSKAVSEMERLGRVGPERPSPRSYPRPSHVVGFVPGGKDYLREFARWERGEREDKPDSSDYVAGGSASKGRAEYERELREREAERGSAKASEPNE